MNQLRSLSPTISTECHCLTLTKRGRSLDLSLVSHDSFHAQAQASDICRAFDADTFTLSYKEREKDNLSELFRCLAFNDFETKKCTEWQGKFANDTPCIYTLGQRFYIKSMILKYLDIPKDDATTKTVCKSKPCINPYHYMYVDGKNAKLSCGDVKMLVAYRSQGTGARQIAKALNVHRSTIYRRLNNERLSAGASGNRERTRER